MNVPPTPAESKVAGIGEGVKEFVHKPSIEGAEKLGVEVKNFVNSPEVATLAHDAGPLLKETKTGYKTTEFWGAIAAIVADLATDISSKNKIVVSALAGVYAVARGIAKAGVPTFEK